MGVGRGLRAGSAVGAAVLAGSVLAGCTGGGPTDQVPVPSISAGPHARRRAAQRRALRRPRAARLLRRRHRGRAPALPGVPPGQLGRPGHRRGRARCSATTPASTPTTAPTGPPPRPCAARSPPAATRSPSTSPASARPRSTRPSPRCWSSSWCSRCRGRCSPSTRSASWSTAQPVDDLWGVPTADPVRRGDTLALRSPVQIDEPADGATVGPDVVVSGRGGGVRGHRASGRSSTAAGSCSRATR